MTRFTSINFVRRGKKPDKSKLERQLAERVKHSNAVGAAQRSLEPPSQRGWAYRHARGCQEEKNGLAWMDNERVSNTDLPRNDRNADVGCRGKAKLSITDRKKLLLKTRDWGLYDTSSRMPNWRQSAPECPMPSPGRAVHDRSHQTVLKADLHPNDEPKMQSSNQSSNLLLTNSSPGYTPLYDDNHDHNAEESKKSILRSPALSTISHCSTGSSVMCNYDKYSNFNSIHNAFDPVPNYEYSYDNNREPFPLVYDSYPMNVYDRQQLIRAVYLDKTYSESQSSVELHPPPPPPRPPKQITVFEDFFNHFTPSQTTPLPSVQRSQNVNLADVENQVSAYRRPVLPSPTSQLLPKHSPGILSFHHPCMDAKMAFPYVYRPEASKHLPAELISVNTGWPYEIIAGMT